VLVVNPPEKWDELGGAARNTGKNGRTGDLIECIVEIHLDCDASRVRTNPSTECVSKRWRPARDPCTGRVDVLSYYQILSDIYIKNTHALTPRIRQISEATASFSAPSHLDFDSYTQEQVMN
jgi:hypothetical protein